MTCEDDVDEDEYEDEVICDEEEEDAVTCDED